MKERIASNTGFDDVTNEINEIVANNMMKEKIHKSEISMH